MFRRRMGLVSPEKSRGISAFMVPGREDSTRMRSAALMASERSWVTSTAVFPFFRMMELMSSQTVSRV